MTQTLTVSKADLAAILAGLVREGVGFECALMANGDYLVTFTGGF